MIKNADEFIASIKEKEKHVTGCICVYCENAQLRAGNSHLRDFPWVKANATLSMKQGDLEHENQQLKAEVEELNKLRSSAHKKMQEEAIKSKLLTADNIKLRDLVKEASSLIEDSTFDYDAGFKCFNGWLAKAKEVLG
jgi:predicted RNase H-like nuclease (RuvC/YqgF family)